MQRSLRYLQNDYSNPVVVTITAVRIVFLCLHTKLRDTIVSDRIGLLASQVYLFPGVTRLHAWPRIKMNTHFEN